MEAVLLSDLDLDRGFLALADPTRRAILARLAQGEATVLELTRPSGISQPAVSKHLKVLEQAGLISRRKEAQRRPCRLEAQRLRDLADWVNGYREFWESSYQRLDTYLETLQERTDP
jgi:DNA-binding transcriptional ArsR family regulator